MKKTLFLGLAAFSFSCSSFSDVATATRSEHVDGYVSVENPQLRIRSLTFCDLQFATDREQFKELKGSAPEFNDIVFYARTTDDQYDYYLLLDPKRLREQERYFYKDTLIENSRFVLAISKSVPQEDLEFILHGLSSLQQ
jgi:hypothetical protein